MSARTLKHKCTHNKKKKTKKGGEQKCSFYAMKEIYEYKILI